MLYRSPVEKIAGKLIGAGAAVVVVLILGVAYTHMVSDRAVKGIQVKQSERKAKVTEQISEFHKQNREKHDAHVRKGLEEDELLLDHLQSEIDALDAKDIQKGKKCLECTL